MLASYARWYTFLPPLTEEKEADEKARHEAMNEVLLEYIRDQRFPNRDKNSPEWAWKRNNERPVHPLARKNPSTDESE